MSERVLTPLRAIKAHCYQCCGDSANEAKLCPAETCPLHKFRLGKNPYRKIREYTEEERQAVAARFAKNTPVFVEGNSLDA